MASPSGCCHFLPMGWPKLGRSSCLPNPLPGREFRRPDLIAREISLMQAGEFGFDDGVEVLPIVGLDRLVGPGCDPRHGVLATHPRVDEFRDDLAHLCAIAKPEGVGFAERLPDRGIARGPTFVGPNEAIPQKVYLVLLVHAEHSLSVGLAGNVREGQRRAIAPAEGDVVPPPRPP